VFKWYAARARARRRPARAGAPAGRAPQRPERRAAQQFRPASHRAAHLTHTPAWSQATMSVARVATVVAPTTHEARERVVRAYFAEGGKGVCGALKKASAGRMNYHTARTLVAEHATLEAALEALAKRRVPGRQTHMS
jgi:hypothetical protein